MIFRFVKGQKGKYRGKICCNDIFCFDIETTTGFLVDEKIIPFDYENANERREIFRESEKFSICYIWQFSINDNIFYGRFLEDFKDFLTELNHYCPYLKIVYIHNLAFELQYLFNILIPDKVFCRKAHKAMTVDFYNINVEMRCSYMLTRLSLDNWSKGKNLSVQKQVGSLDYNVIRTPYTRLSETELNYCFCDLLVMYEGLKQYKEKYTDIWNIPLTQTGEVRRAVQKVMEKETTYKKKNALLMPDTLEDYKRLVNVFIGGSTHANYIYANQIIENVDSWDISSSYPFTQVVYRFPMSPFIRCEYSDIYENDYLYSYIIRIRFYELESILYNSFWSKHKVHDLKRCKSDNGRIMECDYVEISMLNTDFQIFKQCYKWKKMEIVDFHLSVNGYLNNTYRRYILQSYSDKTTLKNVEGFEAIYHNAKEQLNSNYGMAVTREISDEVEYIGGGEWETHLLDLNGFQDKVKKYKRNISKRVIAYQHGIFVPAYGRKRLWDSIIALDDSVVYFDTDSNKNIADDNSFFVNENKKVVRLEKKIANDLGVSDELFNPIANDGKRYRIGEWSYEGRYEKFITLGAKKYCVEKNGKLEMTVSGVRKGAVEALGKIENFRKDFVFDEKSSKKLLLQYENDQRQITFNKGCYDEFTSNYKFSIHMIPTTYELGITPDYLSLILSNLDEKTKIVYEE